MDNNSSSSSSSINVVLPPTSSRCLTKSITATHNFEVTNFALLDGMGIGKYVSSSTFSVGGGHWNIRLYPDGDKDHTPACVSIFLLFLGGKACVRGKLSLSLLDSNNKVIRKVLPTKNNGKRKLLKRNLGFEPTGQKWGWPAFVRRSSLKTLLRTSNESFTIRCVLTVILGHMEDMNTVVVPQSSLQQDLARILKDGEGTDVTFSVGGQLLHAHMSILAARSMVFRAQLWGDTKEKATQQVQIEDMEPSVFEWLLYYIYTDSLPDTYDDGGKIVAMQHLLVAADRYGLDRLRLMCEERLCSWIDVQSVATTLALADQHRCVQLKDACLRFISWRDVLPGVMQTKGFKHLAESCPKIMREVLEKIASATNE